MSEEPVPPTENLDTPSSTAQNSSGKAMSLTTGEKSKFNKAPNQQHPHDSTQQPENGRRGSWRGKGGNGRGPGRAGPRAPRGRPGHASDQAEYSGQLDTDHCPDGDATHVQLDDGGSGRLPPGSGSHASSDEDDSNDDEEEGEEEEAYEDDENESESEEELELPQEAQVEPPSNPKNRPRKPEKAVEASVKVNEKKQPYVRQVELPKGKLSTADLEAKMAAMALKNAQLIAQKKAADQDAAEYREIELQSQKAYEAQRVQQQEIDAIRRVAAERKLGKAQGREWDWEKTEEDWNRSRPYVDSMTNPHPSGNSWGHRGGGFRGGSGRGAPRSRGRGAGRSRGNKKTEGSGGNRATAQPKSVKSQQQSLVDNESLATSQLAPSQEGPPMVSASTSAS